MTLLFLKRKEKRKKNPKRECSVSLFDSVGVTLGFGGGGGNPTAINEGLWPTLQECQHHTHVGGILRVKLTPGGWVWVGIFQSPWPHTEALLPLLSASRYTSASKPVAFVVAISLGALWKGKCLLSALFKPIRFYSGKVVSIWGG